MRLYGYMVMVNDVIWLIAMRMKLGIKNTSDKYDTNTTQIRHKYDTNRPRSKHGHEHTKRKMCLNIMMVICIKQHLRNILSSIYEKVKVAFMDSLYCNLIILIK